MPSCSTTLLTSCFSSALSAEYSIVFVIVDAALAYSPIEKGIAITASIAINFIRDICYAFLFLFLQANTTNPQLDNPATDASISINSIYPVSGDIPSPPSGVVPGVFVTTFPSSALSTIKTSCISEVSLPSI